MQTEVIFIGCKERLNLDLLPLPIEVNKHVSLWESKDYRDKKMLLCHNCRKSCKGALFGTRWHPIKEGERFWGWQIPAKTVKMGCNTMSFNEGCNLYRTKILREVVAAQTSHSKSSYRPSNSLDDWAKQHYGDIEIKVDGQVKLSLDEAEKGNVKDFMKQYTTRIRVGKKMVNLGVGEADRVKPS